MAGDGRPPAHAGTYDSFIRWFTWGTAICVLLAAFVVWLIAS
ncbi:aa3-type cytochrome c oxidase subunit IV [Sphingomonas silueang]